MNRKNKKNTIITTFVLIALIITSCNSKTEDISSSVDIPSSSNVENVSESSHDVTVSGSDYEVVETDNAKYNFKNDYLTDDEKRDFVDVCERGIKNIKEYLGEEYIINNNKLIYFIDDGNYSGTDENGVITLGNVKTKEAEYIHETVHGLTEYKNPLWIDEGFATYVDYKFTEYANPPLYNNNPHAALYDIIYVQDKEYITILSDEVLRNNERHLAYVAASSLVLYIEETRGEDTILKLFDDFKKAEDILGAEFSSVKIEWLEYIKNYNL